MDDELRINAVKVLCFLRNNQLVQANGVLQKIEAKLEERIEAPNSKQFLDCLRMCLRAKSYILAGSDKEATTEIESLVKAFQG